MTRPIHTLNCLICGEQFHARYPLAKYCSASCKEASKYRRTGPKRRNRIPVPRELISRMQSDYRTCAECGIEDCGCRYPAYAPSPEQIEAGMAEARRLHLAGKMSEA